MVKGFSKVHKKTTTRSRLRRGVKRHRYAVQLACLLFASASACLTSKFTAQWDLSEDRYTRRSSTLPPWSRLLAPGVFKLSCSILLYLSTSQLFFIWCFSPSAVSFRPSVFAVRSTPCRRRMGSWWPKSPWGPTRFFGPDFS